MIDLQSETVVSFVEASKTLPRRRGGKRPHVATLYRWAQNGIRGVKLESLRVGGTLCTSLEALQRFCNRLSGNDPTGSSPTRARQREIATAESELERAGI